MTERRLGRRELLGLAGAAAFCAACSGASVTLPPQGSRAGKGATSTPGSAPASTSPPPIQPTASLPVADLSDVSYGSRSQPKLALTFHGAGPVPLAKAVLAELARAQVHVTVFAVGSWLVAEPAMARLILDGGHELGNHTYTHLPMRTLSSPTARTEVARCATVLKQLTGTHGAWFRPSGTQASTATIRAAARASGYPRCISYDVDSLDWTDPAPAAVTRQVLGKARAGSIVSMHLGHAATVSALPGLLDGLVARSLAPVTVSQLLG